MRVYIHCDSVHERRIASDIADQLGVGYEVVVPELDKNASWVRFLPSGDVVRLQATKSPMVRLFQRLQTRRQLIWFASFSSALLDRRIKGRRLRSIVRFIETDGWWALIKLGMRKMAEETRASGKASKPEAGGEASGAAQDSSAEGGKAPSSAGLSVPDQARTKLRQSMNAAGRIVITPPLLTIGIIYQWFVLARRADVLKTLGVDCVVMFEDNIETGSREVAVAAEKVGVGYVVLPTTIPNPIEAAHYYASDRQRVVEGPLGRLIRKLKPGWVFHYEGHDRLRLQPLDIVLYEITGLATRQPWLLNYGPAEKVGIDSQWVGERYRALGFPPEQLHLIGSLVDDVLFDTSRNRSARREEWLSRFELVDDRPLVLIAIPPNQFTAPSTSGFEYTSYNEMLLGWIAAIAPLTPWVNILAVKHPRTMAEDVACFAAAGVPLVEAATETLVPLCDLYIASISATIRWALALGIPVINYDCYRYRYGDYTGASGLVEVEDRASFEQALRGILRSPGRLDELTERQADQASEWGIIDGRFALRLRELLKQMAGRGPKNRQA